VRVVYERCCGLDVHQETVVACLLTGRARSEPSKEIRTFSTFTQGLEALRAWLTQERCEAVIMESTGVYWMPVYEVLESGPFELVVANAAHVKNVLGRKTDVKDAEWLADLLRIGNVRKSYIPEPQIRELRKVVRYRRTVVEARVTERNHLLKQLELGNIKLASVASDVFGKSGWAMLKALVDDQQTPEQMAELARGTLRRKLEPLRKALRGRLGDQDRWILQRLIVRLEELDAEVALADARIDQMLAPHEELRQRLATIPGISLVVAAVIIAEIGLTVDSFPSHAHLAKWAGLCPGNNESAGKRRDGRIRGGNPFLRSILVEAALSAVRTRGSRFKGLYYSLKRLGHKKAIVAVAHKMLVAIYHMMRSGQAYRELGENYRDRLHEDRVVRHGVARLEALGYKVQLTRRDEPQPLELLVEAACHGAPEQPTRRDEPQPVQLLVEAACHGAPEQPTRRDEPQPVQPTRRQRPQPLQPLPRQEVLMFG